MMCRDALRYGCLVTVSVRANCVIRAQDFFSFFSSFFFLWYTLIPLPTCSYLELNIQDRMSIEPFHSLTLFN